MQFISDDMGKEYAAKYSDLVKSYLNGKVYSTHTYIPMNTEAIDNKYSNVNTSYEIRPDIQINYPVPYNYGACMKNDEVKPTSFDLQNRSSLNSAAITK
jgi:hypothetical protein